MAALLSSLIPLLAQMSERAKDLSLAKVEAFVRACNANRALIDGGTISNTTPPQSVPVVHALPPAAIKSIALHSLLPEGLVLELWEAFGPVLAVKWAEEGAHFDLEGHRLVIDQRLCSQ